MTGVELSQGAITQDALRRARGRCGRLGTVGFGSLCVRARWCTPTTAGQGVVGGESAFLMAFETEDATVYQVRSRHRNEEVREVVPADYAGVMVTDRARSYDAQALSGVRQQKCLAHVLRSISEVIETKVGRGRSFGKRLSELLREAMELRESERRGEVADYGGETERLRREVSHHLRDRPLSDRDNWRLQNELGWQDDRGNLLRFLDDPGIEPTNNRAERALRGAVIARKVSHCSRNETGADAFSAFTSVIRTLVSATVASETLPVEVGGGRSVRCMFSGKRLSTFPLRSMLNLSPKLPDSANHWRPIQLIDKTSEVLYLPFSTLSCELEVTLWRNGFHNALS